MRQYTNRAWQITAADPGDMSREGRQSYLGCSYRAALKAAKMHAAQGADG